MLRKVPALLLALLLATGLAWAQGEDPPPAEPTGAGETAETAEDTVVAGEEIEAEPASDISTMSARIGDGMIAPSNIVVAD